MKSDVFFPLDQADWPALLVDGSGIIRRANQAAVAAFGSSIEGNASLAASIWSAENAAKAEPFLAQLERAPEPLVPLKFRVKGGASISFLTYLCPVLKDGQKHFLFQLFRQDEPAPKAPPPAAAAAGLAPTRVPSGLSKSSAPTREPAANGSAEESSTAQKQKLECALQLARTVALDFNNALTSILGHTSLLLGKMAANHPWRHSLLAVEKSAERAAEIANHLAAFSRPDKDAQAVAEGNLNQLLQRSVAACQASAPLGLAWSLQLESKLYSVQIDEAKMQQALVKILENAVEATAGRGAITVHTRNLELKAAHQDGAVRLSAGNYVSVEVTDTGCGIEPAVLPRIFEPFFTTKRDPRHRGLGLAWVYGIVTNHGGSVAVTSQPGKGTTVRLYLPALKKVVRTSSVPAADLTGDQTVLVVDDEDLLLTMAETVLSDYGYRVMTAKSGEQALEIVNAGLEIDLLITDMVMPGMSGRELITKVRRLAPQVRILCASGYARPAQAEEDEVYLQKPFTSQDLLRKVKEALVPRG
jgi:signal transduction histidine kinase